MSSHQRARRLLMPAYCSPAQGGEHHVFESRSWGRFGSLRAGHDPATEFRDALNRPLPIAAGRAVTSIFS
ncbi:MAG: hypothetical protein U0790_27605 [Isosphaeraceae bacterium]